MALKPNQTIQPIKCPTDVRAGMKAQKGQQHSGTAKRHLLGPLMTPSQGHLLQAQQELSREDKTPPRPQDDVWEKDKQQENKMSSAF